MSIQNFILPSCYLPPISYFSLLCNAEDVLIEEHEFFVKQTYRNRCSIYGANGKLDLIIPLTHGKEKTILREKKISYASPWQTIHWKSIESAYRSSPYFEFFEQEFKQVFFERKEYLFEFNRNLLRCILEFLREKPHYTYSEEWKKNYTSGIDLRLNLNPKNPTGTTTLAEPVPYYQVFGSRNGFIPHLSIIDLLFNTGLKSTEILADLFTKQELNFT